MADPRPQQQQRTDAEGSTAKDTLHRRETFKTEPNEPMRKQAHREHNGTY